MSVHNLAIQLMPQSLDEIYGHDDYLTIIKSWIVNDKLPPAMLITGSPGVGKGAFVHNIIKTALCRTRNDRSTHRCGKCLICKMDPRITNPQNNVMWIQTGNKITNSNKGTIDSQIKEAIEYASSPPRGNPSVDLGSRYHKFIVIDEIQGLKNTLLEELLFILEIGSILEENKVTFIMVTMDEPRFEAKNPALYKALVGRCGKGYIQLHEPSKLRLHEYALKKLGVTDPLIRNLLVESAEGSYRDLIKDYEKTLDLPECTPYLVECILKKASRPARRKFWQYFSNANNSKASEQFKLYWESLVERFGQRNLIKQLLNDLDEMRVHKQDIPLSFIRSLVECKNDPTIPVGLVAFSPYQGKSVYDLPYVDEESVSNEELKLSEVSLV